jgi:arabinofuranosyltransferase
METSALGLPRYSRREVTVLFLAWLGLFLYVIARAWVAEDAYITFRVVENFFDGYGLRWNIRERVQAYTHPLWMLLHLPLYFVLPNIFLDTIILSVLCAALAIFVSLYSIRKPVLIALACFMLPLFYSKSFLDYTSSGLENPLSYLLFAVFGHVMLNKHDHPRFWFYASLTVALALLNRLDMLLVYGPAMAYALWKRGSIPWKPMILGFLPLLAWFAFSLFYYGFLFPNTKYAKLETGLSLWQHASQGLWYAKSLLIRDTPGALMIAAPLAVFALRKRFAIPSPVPFPQLGLFLAMGIYLYCAYVVYVGGDYMAGRFWAFPIFAATWFFFASCPQTVRIDVLFALACLLGTAYIVPQQLHEIRKVCPNCITLKGRVMDARTTFKKNQLFISHNPPRIRYEGQYVFGDKGRILARMDPAPIHQTSFIGMSGFYAGPKAHLVDEVGLADPLLARLPAIKKQVFYIGHFRRNIPRGYLKTLQKNNLRFMDRDLVGYYEKLQLIVSGGLLDPERLKTIVLFNLGYYDHLKDEYLRNNPQ